MGDAAATAAVSRSLPLAPLAGAAAIDLEAATAAFGVALHMHQPTVLAAGMDLATSPLISNLRHMLDHPNEGDNHDAPVFLRCYGRSSDLVEGLRARGRNPRLMLDYSGNLLWGLQQMGESSVLDALQRTHQLPLQPHVEWLGTMWSHAVASSTPIPDLELHIIAWRHAFAALFGLEAVQRVRGFSPPEMHLPIHPDVCFAYVRALRRCGYRWIMVQEHTIERLEGGRFAHPHLPHQLVARSSTGEVETITALLKTQGSDTKLVGQMQPYGEAQSLRRQELSGCTVPPYVLQIGDGENGGVMMNEFPSAYERAFDSMDGRTGTVAMNGSEYLGALAAAGVDESGFEKVQPIGQHRIWEQIAAQGPGPGAADAAISEIRRRDPSFDLDRASWTSDRSWVRGYESVLDPMTRLSAAFHQRWDGVEQRESDPRYGAALLHVLLSQTSCFRYWGQGRWTDMAAEIARRGMRHLQAD